MSNADIYMDYKSKLRSAQYQLVLHRKNDRGIAYRCMSRILLSVCRYYRNQMSKLDWTVRSELFGMFIQN